MDIGRRQTDDQRCFGKAIDRHEGRSQCAKVPERSSKSVNRTVIHLLLSVVLLAASPLRALCSYSCVSDTDAVQTTGHDEPACHESHESSPPSDSNTSDDGCRHGDESPARSLRTAHKPVDLSADSRALLHVAPAGVHDGTAMTPRVGVSTLPFHAVPAPRRFPTPLRI